MRRHCASTDCARHCRLHMRGHACARIPHLCAQDRCCCALRVCVVRWCALCEQRPLAVGLPRTAADTSQTAADTAPEKNLSASLCLPCAAPSERTTHDGPVNVKRTHRACEETGALVVAAAPGSLWPAVFFHSTRTCPRGVVASARPSPTPPPITSVSTSPSHVLRTRLCLPCVSPGSQSDL